MTKRLVEGLGWYGVAAILGAYVAVSFGYMRTDTVVFQALNLSGAAGIVIDALHAKNWQPAVLNAIWLIVALVSLVRILL
jgi:hypothetical protein